MSEATLHIIEWLDAHYNTGEFDASEVRHEPWGYTTVGILIRSDEKGVTVASDIGEDGRFRSINFVPRGMITNEYSLGPLKPHKRKSTRTRKSPHETHSSDPPHGTDVDHPGPTSHS